MAKIGEAIEWMGDFISDSIRTFTSSNFAKNTAEFGYKAAKSVGKAGFDAGLKVGAAGMETLADSVDFIRRNKDTIKNVSSKMANGVLDEVGTVGRAAAGLFELGEKAHIIERTSNLDTTLIGLKVTKGAKFGMLPLAAGVGLIAGGKDSLENRQGRNDGQVRTPTAAMNNPYDISQQMAYSQMGRSFADNAGADGDLVRAISNMR